LGLIHYINIILFTYFFICYTIFTLARNRNPLSAAFLNRAVLNTHPEIRTLMLTYLQTNWDTLLNYRNRFFFILYSTVFTSLLAIIRPMWLIRLFTGVILTSIGILWNETLHGIEYLKYSAYKIISILDYYGFSIPIPTSNELKNSEMINKSTFYTVLGIIILGTLTCCIAILCLEYYLPPQIEPTPLSSFDKLYNWLKLDQIKFYYISLNEVTYEHFPNLYNYFFSPIKSYIINPAIYTITKPVIISYDYVLHPLTDVIRNSYQFIINYFYPRPPINPPLSPIYNTDPRVPSPRIPSPISDFGEVPDEMSSSTETIRPPATPITPTNPFYNYFPRTASGSGSGMFSRTSSSGTIPSNV